MPTSGFPPSSLGRSVVPSFPIAATLGRWPGGSADRQYAGKATAKVDFARIFSMLVELFYSYDRTAERVAPPCAQPSCALSYVAGSAHQLGLNATLQARF